MKTRAPLDSLSRCIGRNVATVLSALIVLAAIGTVRAAEVAAYRADPLGVRADALVTAGFEAPAASIAALHALMKEHGKPDERRVLLQSIGALEALGGNAVRAGEIAEQLRALAVEDPGGRALAASNLVRSMVAENAGQLDVAAALAESALPAFEAGCPGTNAAVPPPASTASGAAPVCNYRSAWRVLQVLERRARSQGLTALATTHARRALELAEWAGDAMRRATNTASLALFASERADHEETARLAAQARRLAAQAGGLAPAYMLNVDARIASAQGNEPAALRFYQEALQLAMNAQATRLQATVLTNLSDAYMRLGRPAQALDAAERGLVLVRARGDLRLERVLTNNAGIAKIGMGRVTEGKRDLARLLDLWKSSGETGRQATTLLEFGEALAAAGDARGALDLYHQEQALSAQMRRVNRAIALKDLQTRNDAEARQRDIELLARDNALKTEALANRDLAQRIWWLLAAVMVVAIVLVTLLYRRVRETHVKLAASHLQLQAQSERDPLTNLANRRHFHAVMNRLCDQGGFEGALLLVDIDHFKHVNDMHGHAGGDQVLVEVAERLNAAVRSDDLVVRWGGEEFLVLAPHAAGEQAEQMAARVLRSIGQLPFGVGEGLDRRPVRVTASIGYARFPLPPAETGVPWEQAVNLADMALYTAMNQGRNRAVGIVSTTAWNEQTLRDLEADFDRAWRDGRVTLAQTTGPDSKMGALAA